MRAFFENRAPGRQRWASIGFAKAPADPSTPLMLLIL